MKKAQPERYISRLSATVVTIFKLLDGIVAGFALYHITRIITLVMTELTKGALDINHALQIILSEYGLSQSTSDVFRNIMIGGMVFPVVVWGGMLFVVIIGLTLVIIEAIALLSLRLTQRGAGIIKVIHQIYMGVCVLNLILFVYSIVMYFQYRKNIGGAVLAADITVIFIGVTCLIGLLLHMCYHKDISMAMSTVMYEVETGNQGNLRRTHLSGISFIFGLPYASLILYLVLGIVALKRDASLSQYNLTTVQWVSAIGIPAIMMIKHLSICFCNRNLKRAR